MDPEVRRLEQVHLIEGYLARLAGLGVPDVPTIDAALLACRRAALWGLVIGWLICPPENYGSEITIANIARTVAAVADLDTLGAIR
jgi:hypothetical protein